MNQTQNHGYMKECRSLSYKSIAYESLNNKIISLVSQAFYVLSPYYQHPIIGLSNKNIAYQILNKKIISLVFQAF